MRGIYIDTLENELAYLGMQKLKEDWDSAKPQFPEPAESSGLVTVELEQIRQEYEKLHLIMGELFANTAEFIRKADDMFTTSDEKMAEAIKAE